MINPLLKSFSYVNSCPNPRSEREVQFSLTARPRLRASGLRCPDDPSRYVVGSCELNCLVVRQAKERPSSFAACGLHKEEVLEEECLSL